MASQKTRDLSTRKGEPQAKLVRSVTTSSSRKSAHAPSRPLNTPDVRGVTESALGGAIPKSYKPAVEHAPSSCWDENETPSNPASSTRSRQHKTGATTATATAADKVCALQINCLYYVQHINKCQNATVEYLCSIKIYMKWKFLLCSQLKRGNLSSDKYCLYQDATLVLQKPAINALGAENMVKTLIGEIVDTHCREVSVERFYEELPERSVIHQVNEQVYQDVFAEIIDGVFYMACLSGQKLDILRSVLELIKKTRISNSQHYQKVVKVQPGLLKFDAVILEIIGKDFPQVKVEMQEQSGHAVCALQGSREEVERAASSVVEIDNTVCRRPVELQPYSTQLLLKPHIQDKVRSKLSRKIDNCWLFVDNEQVCVVGFNKNVLHQAADYVARQITTWTKQMKSDNIVHLIQKKCGHDVLVIVDQVSQMHVVGLEEDVEEVKALVVDIEEGRVSLVPGVSDIQPVFIPPAVFYKYTIGNDRMVKFLKKTAHLEKIAECHNCKVKLTDDNVVEIQGDEGAILEAKHDFEIFMKNIEHHFIDITDQNEQKYMLYSEYVDVIATECEVNIEKIYKTLITCASNLNLTIEKKSCRGLVSWETCFSLSKRQLIIEELDEKVDHHDGLHMKFIQSDPESSKRLKKTDNILSIKVPDWIEGHMSLPETFSSDISKGLDKMSSRQIEKLAIYAQPVGGWEFSPFMKCIVMECTKWLVESPNIYPYQVTVIVDGSDNTELAVTLVDTFILENMSRNDERPLVKIVEDSLDQTKADILVNTAAPNLDLKHGRVSAALSKAAGLQLQQECNRKYSMGIHYDDVAYTQGFNLNCRSVYHVTIPLFLKDEPDHQDNFMSIRNPMMNCLMLASKHKGKTIAFPAIGTGKLGYPMDVVASEMFGCIKRFRQENPTTSLEEVLFVIYHKDTELLKIFRDFQHRFEKKTEACWQHEMRLEITGLEDGIESARSQINKKLKIISNPNAEISEWFGDVPMPVCTVLYEMYYHIEAEIKKLTKFTYDKEQQGFKIRGKVGFVVRFLQMIMKYTETIKNMHQCQVSLNGIDKGNVKNILAGIKKNADEGLFYAYNNEPNVVELFAFKSNVLRAAEGCIIEKLEKSLNEGEHGYEGTRESEVEDEHTREGEIDGEGKRGGVDKVTKEREGKVEPGRTLVQRSFSWSQNTSNLQVFTNKTLLVRVYEGNLLTAPVDAIVNAANEALEHFGGIAHAIKKHAGDGLVKESENIIRQQPGRILPVSSVVKTTAGNLPYQCVFHAVGPFWSAYKPITKESLQCCERDLRNTITNCLKTANERELTSIALPAISAGLFAVPLEICAEQYAQAIIQYGKHETLQEVHFVNNDSPSKIIPIIHQVFTEMITKNKPSPFPPKDQYLDATVAAGNLPDAGTSMGKGRKNMKNTGRSKPSSVGDDEASELKRQHKDAEVKSMKNTGRSKPPSVGDDEVSELKRQHKDVEVTVNVCHRVEDNCLMCVITERETWYMYVYQGNIFNVKNVKALVCGDNKLGSGKGMIASELARLGGKEYLEAKSWEFTENSPKISDVVTTTIGNNCRYKWIMHVIIPRNSVRLYDAYRNIFEEVRRRRLQSIVLPLLGTGNADISPSDSAEALWVEWILCYEKYRDDLHPLKVHVVLRDQTVLTEVQDLFKTYVDNIEKRRMALGGAEGHREAPGGAEGHREADECRVTGKGVDKHGVTTRGADKHKDTTGRPVKHKETTGGVEGRKEATGGAVGRKETTGGAVGGKETTGGAVGRKETTGGAVGRKETTGGAEGHKEATGGAVGNRQAIGGDEGHREATGGAEVKASSQEVKMCVICMDQMDNPKMLKCGHFFCTDCIDGYFKVKKVCPTCGQVCGTVTGDQPDGVLEIKKVRRRLSGYNKDYCLALTYTFLSSKQGPNHPQPGKPYKGINRTGYLPDTDEGRQICAMMKIAFERSLVFTIGTSRTTGEQGVITWNDIHHKTDTKPNTQFGYPDATYLDRVTDELAVKGVTHADIDKKFLKKLKDDTFKETVTVDLRTNLGTRL